MLSNGGMSSDADYDDGTLTKPHTTATLAVNTASDLPPPYSYQRGSTAANNASYANGINTPTGTVAETPANKRVTSGGGMESADARRDRLLKIYLPNNGILQWLIIKSLVWIFPLELFLLMLPVFINYGVCSDMYATTADPAHRGGAIFIFAFFHFFSFAAIISATFVLVFELGHHIVKPSHLVSMYFAIVIHYASWYQFVYACNQASIYILNSDAGHIDTSTDLANRMIVFIYLELCYYDNCRIGRYFPSDVVV